MKVINQISAGGIVFKNEGGSTLWLITQHSEHKGWVFPKGLVGDTDKNESMESAALREVLEEGGVTAQIVNSTPIETHYEYKWEGDMIKKTVFYYIMEYKSGDPADHDWEMMDARFTDAATVKKMLTYDSDKAAFTEALDTL